MKKIIIYLLTIIVILTTVGCQKDNHERENENISSYQEEPLDNPVSIVDEDYLKNGKEIYDGSYDSQILIANILNGLSFKLLRKIYKKNNNEFFSPYSLFNALALVANGANGDSQKALSDFFGSSLFDMNQYLKDNNKKIENIGSIFNKLWLDSSKNIEYKDDFFKIVEKYYESDVRKMSFIDKEGLSEDINSWINEKTKGMIKEMITPEEISDNSALFLLNALTIDANWKERFLPQYTYLDNFNNYDGTIGTVEMMHQVLMQYLGNDKMEGICLSTENNIDVYFIVPKEESIYELIDSLNYQDFNSFIENKLTVDNCVNSSDENEYATADRHFTVFSLPKFSYECKYELKDILIDMGLEKIFDSNQADFSHLTNKNDQISLNRITQKDIVKTDENHLEAAGSTIVEFSNKAILDKTKYTDYYHVIDFNRPFIYLIKYNQTILFTGVVSNFKEDDSKIKIAANKELEIKTECALNSINLSLFESGNCLTTKEGDILYAYEIVENNEGKWYRIGDSAWIFDYDGSSIIELN